MMSMKHLISAKIACTDQGRSVSHFKAPGISVEKFFLYNTDISTTLETSWVEC